MTVDPHSLRLGLVTDVASVAEIVDRLSEQFEAARCEIDWRGRLAGTNRPLLPRAARGALESSRSGSGSG